MLATIYVNISKLAQPAANFKTLTIGSAHPGSFHAGLLLHSGSLAMTVEFIAV